MEPASHSLARIEEATGRLLATAAALSDDKVREPSALPGWTRGHVLSHIARNADGMVNLLTWARTGIESPMYASARARAADIEAGVGRGAADLAADVRESAEAFAAEAARVPDEAWTVLVRALHGPPFPAVGVLERRLSEVEIHHVDLAAGYSPGDWPGDFVAAALPRVAASFTGRDDAPSCLVWADGIPGSFPVGPEHPGSHAVAVHGPPADLLAWLTGRGPGTRLAVPSGAPLPALPPWR
jgi:maleylpyruvate isomerase